MTLHFLGGMPSERVPELQRGLAVPFTPFRLSIGVPKLWPHGIAVLEPHEEPPELLELHANSIVRPGRARPAAGSAHLPPPRDAGAARQQCRRAAGASRSSGKIDGYALVESKPGNGGGYTVLRKQYA
jgi:2'-5' RNA ligase